MGETQTKVYQVRARAREVADHHFDAAKPGKPLRWLIPGGLLALAALAVAVTIAYQTWYGHKQKPQDGIVQLLLVLPFYVAGVFIWSYGYELYDLPKAVKLTAIIVVVTVLAVVILAALLSLAGGSKGRSRSSSSKSSSGSGSPPGGSSSGSGLNLDLGLRSAHGAGPAPAAAGSVGPILPPPLASTALACPSCGKAFFIAPGMAFCPSCGAPLPPGLLPPG